MLSMHLKTTTLFDFTIMFVSFQQELQLPTMLTLFIGISIAVLVLTWLSTSTRRKGEILGKLGIPFIGQTFAFLAATNSTKGCYDFVRLRRSRYGQWFKTRLFGNVHVYVPTVEGAKTVFANDFVLFNKGYLKSMGDMVGKKSLLRVPHEIHGRMRRLLSDPFSMKSVSKFVPKFDRELCERLERLERAGKSFRVLEFTMKVAFDGICDMLMSITDASTLERLERDVTVVADAMLSFPIMLPGSRYYSGMKARKRILETLKAKITRRRNGQETGDDFLQSMLQRDSCPPNERLDDEEIMDNLLTMIIAGQSTTAAAIMWCVKFLDENKQVQDRLREEQLSILGKNGVGALLKYEDLMSMAYGSKVVKETLRMANVLLWYPRVALHDCTIEGFEIKKGWKVNIDATHIHYDPTIYTEPMRFNPSRFDILRQMVRALGYFELLIGSKGLNSIIRASVNARMYVTNDNVNYFVLFDQDMQKPCSYIPFGSGPRTCLGINMAKVTMLVFLHRLTGGYTWIVDDDDPGLERKAHIPRLQSGCPITLTRLDSKA